MTVGWCFHGLVVEQKFLRVQHRPEHVFVALALALRGSERFAVGSGAGLFEVGFGEGDLGGIRLAGVGEEMDVAEFFVVAARVGGELCGGAGIGGELFLDVFGVQQMEGLGEAGFRGALALAGAG